MPIKSNILRLSKKRNTSYEATCKQRVLYAKFPRDIFIVICEAGLFQNLTFLLNIEQALAWVQCESECNHRILCPKWQIQYGCRHTGVAPPR